MEKRLFIGVKITPSEELIALFTKLKNSLNTSDIKWVDTNNMHLTLMFLGSVLTSKIEEISKKLKLISQSYHNFEMKIIGLGKFQRNQVTSVIWAGIKDEGNLKDLASAIVENMVDIGFEAEKRKFTPHLTLGRVKSTCDEIILDNYININKGKIIQNIQINEIILFESILKPSGPHYHKLLIYELVN